MCFCFQITSRADSNTDYAWTDFVNFDEATSYNGLNQLLSVTAQSTAPLYDGRGNMTRDHQGQTYEYDHYNRLTGVGLCGRGADSGTGRPAARTSWRAVEA